MSMSFDNLSDRVNDDLIESTVKILELKDVPIKHIKIHGMQ